MASFVGNNEKMPEERLSIPGSRSCSQPEDETLVKDHFFQKNIEFTLVGKRCLLGVDNQGRCSCCWAFTALEAIAAARARKNKSNVIPLSKQHLIDCMFTHYEKPPWFAKLKAKQCYTCSCTRAYMFATDFGVVEETKYPYTEERGDCKGQSEVDVVKINGFKRIDLKSMDKKEIKKLIKKQPITCGAPFVPSLKDHVGKKIYMGPTETEIEAAEKLKKEAGNKKEAMHAMLIVGYGEENGTEFYLVKNSWGEEWGYKGFAKIECSVLSRLSYPILSEL